MSASAEPAVSGFGQIVGKNGNPIGGNGPPTIAASWTPDPGLNPWNVAEGRAPEADGEVAIDKKVADDQDIAVGDTITVLTPNPTQVEVVGILTIGGEDSLGAVTFAAFTFDQAQKLFMPSPDKASEIDVSAEERRQPGPARREPRPGPARRRRSHHRQRTSPRRTTTTSTRQFLGFFEAFLLVFAGHRAARRDVQHLQHVLDHHRPAHARVRPAARDRRLPRRRCSASIALESLAIGLVASILGLLVGIAARRGPPRRCSTRSASAFPPAR